VQLTVVPRVPGDYDSAVEGPIGVGLMAAPDGRRITRGPGEALVDSAASMWEIVSLTVRVPAMLINGDITPSEARPVSVVGISQIAGQAAEVSVTNSNLFPILNMVGFISVALGFTNLLPIPALDGGRIMFVLIEAVRGRRIEPEREGMVHIVGMLVLLGLMVLLIVQDIVNPIF
jgi:regulator of sigma E protease